MTLNKGGCFMKRNFKRTTFSAVSALLIASMIAVSPICNVSAVANPLNPVCIMPPSENGHQYTTDNLLVCDAESLLISISNGKSVLCLATTEIVNEIEKEPVTIEEMKNLYDSYKFKVFLAKDTLNLFTIKCNNTENYTKSIWYHNPEIKYIANGDTRQILDYKTNEVLHDFNKGDWCYYFSKEYKFSNLLIYDEDYNSILMSPAEITPDLHYLGDIDQNGNIDLTDLSLLSLHLIGDKELTDDIMTISDMTNDGNINLSDLASMKKYIMNTL